MTHPPKLSVLVGVAFIALGSFAAGWAVGDSAFATSVNSGLVTAMNSVGQNLFGTAVFGVTVPPNPIVPPNPTRLDFGDNSLLPITLNVFNKQTPTDPCRSYLQVAIADGDVVLTYDPTYAPEGFSATAVAADLSTVYPATSQCPAPPPCVDC